MTSALEAQAPRIPAIHVRGARCIARAMVDQELWAASGGVAFYI
jgi:hypothetical protein